MHSANKSQRGKKEEEKRKLSRRKARTHLDDLAQLHRLLSSSLEIINRENLEARVVNELVGLLHVGALQTGNDGDLEVERLDDSDQTLGDGIAAHNTAEDVDKNGRDLGIGGDQLEGLLDGGRGSTTADVKEVSRLAAIQLDNIHGGHGQTGTVDQAADVTVELDEVQAGLRGANLLGILLGGVAPAEDLFLAELGIVVEAELGVHAHDLVVRGLTQRVDLDLGGILLEEDLVELLDGVLGVLDALLAEAKLSGDVAGDLVGDANVDVNVSGDDSLRVLLRNGLDVHATLGRRDDDGALRGAVHQDGQVELTAGELALADVNGIAETAGGARLLGDELVADHLLGKHLRLGRRVDDTHTALQAVVEAALATAASQHLGLDHHVFCADLLGHLLGLGSVVGDGALGDGDAILAVAGSASGLPHNLTHNVAYYFGVLSYLTQQVVRAVFVDAQVSPLLGEAGGSDGGRERGLQCRVALAVRESRVSQQHNSRATPCQSKLSKKRSESTEVGNGQR